MDDLVAARERFEAAIPGWRAPVAQGLGLVRAGAPDAVEYPVVNTSRHGLPVVVLATVLGHAGGTATYDVGRDQLDAAVASRDLAPVASLLTDEMRRILQEDIDRHFVMLRILTSG